MPSSKEFIEKAFITESKKDKVKQLLIKYGNNPKDVDAMIKQEFATALKNNPTATPAKLAEIIRTLY